MSWHKSLFDLKRLATVDFLIKMLFYVLDNKKTLNIV